MPTERVTVTFPPQVVREIDRIEQNRSKFIQQAVDRELERRRREALRTSLENPHPETAALADLGLGDWAERIPEGAVSDLLDPSEATEIRWIQGEGWSET